MQENTNTIKTIFKSKNENKFLPLDPFSLSAHIKQGAVGVIGTDSFYRIVGDATSPEVVNRIREIKSRELNKSLTIFISDVEQMREFGVEITDELLRGAKTYWPGTYSIVTPTTRRHELPHLTCEAGNLCFHMPDKVGMFELLDLAGPFVATSASMRGKPNATSIEEAYEYFGDDVDFYCDVGVVENPENIVIQFVNGEVVELFNRLKFLESLGHNDKGREISHKQAALNEQQ